MKKLLIVWHSQSGASLALAVAAQAGAAAQVSVQRLRAVDAGARDVEEADALLLVCAENSGRLAGAAKDFLDRIFYPLHERGVVRPYGLLVSAGNDGRGAVAEAQRIMRGIPLTEATEPLILRGVPGEAALAQARELGEGFATGLSMGIF